MPSKLVLNRPSGSGFVITHPSSGDKMFLQVSRQGSYIRCTFNAEKHFSIARDEIASAPDRTRYQEIFNEV